MAPGGTSTPAPPAQRACAWCRPRAPRRPHATVLLAEQRGLSFAGRVILDRLYGRIADDERRTILLEISLGVFMDAADGIPAMWRSGFFETAPGASQANVLDTARAAGWLRDENLTVLCFAADRCKVAAILPQIAGELPGWWQQMRDLR